MRGRSSLLSAAAIRYWPIFLLFALWQSAVSFMSFSAIVLPRPVDVALDVLFNPDVYISNGAGTFLLAIGGLSLGMAGGTAMAVLVSHSRFLRGILTPMSLIFASIPVVTIIPLLGRIFGYGTATVLIIVAVISYFPAFVFTSSGLRAYTQGNEDFFTVLGAPFLVRLRHLYLPAAVPNWMIAFRLTAPSAFLSAMVAEYLIGRSGLGFLFRNSATTFDTARAFGTSLVATAIAVVVFGLTTFFERKVQQRWT